MKKLEDLIKPLRRKLEIKRIERCMSWLWPRMANIFAGKDINYLVRFKNNIPHIGVWNVVDIDSPEGLYFLYKRTHKGLQRSLEDGDLYGGQYCIDMVKYLKRIPLLKRVA
jgi:hypothetical protein